jgi:hypothetical protein
MGFLHYRRLAALILAAAGAATCGAASAADSNLYFGIKGGVMSSDRSGYDDSWNAGAVVGLHFLDFNKGKSHYGSLSGEIEGTVPLIKGDVNSPSNGEWRTWTLGAYAVYHSPDLNNVYFKGKAGAVHRDITSSPSGISGTGSSDDPAFGVGVGYRVNKRNSVELEVTFMDTLTFISAGFVF